MLEYENINRSEIDFSLSLPNTALLKKAEEILELKFGAMLRYYLEKYGYLGYRSVEFFGINSRQGLFSDLVRQTHFLHNCFSCTKGYAAIENLGDGIYALVDCSDEVYIFNTTTTEMKETGKKLADYILYRFSTVGV